LADQFPPNQRSSNVCSANAPRVQEVCQVWRSAREAFRQVTEWSRQVGRSGGGRSAGTGDAGVAGEPWEPVGGWLSWGAENS